MDVVPAVGYGLCESQDADRRATWNGKGASRDDGDS
jgi:hypothetical protein